MPALIPAPAERLTAVPKLETADDVRVALLELSWLQAEKARRGNECKRKCDALIQECTAGMTVKIGREEVSFADREKAVADALGAYCAEHRGELLEGETKSRKFSHGSIGWRQSPESIDFAEGFNESKVIEKAEEKCGVLSKIRALLGKLFPLSKVPATLFFDVKLTLKRDRIKDARNNGTINDRQLTAAGLVLRPGADNFWFKVDEYPVQREAA